MLCFFVCVLEYLENSVFIFVRSTMVENTKRAVNKTEKAFSLMGCAKTSEFFVKIETVLVKYEH